MDNFPKFSLINYLEKHAPIIGDGDYHKVLTDLGFPDTTATFTANLTHPELVTEAHKLFQEAGANVLRTNTAGAHRITLEELGIADRGEAINNSGMALLREGAGLQSLPAGDIKSILEDMDGKPVKADHQLAYGEQAIYLSDTGARFLILRNFYNFEDLMYAVQSTLRNTQKQVWGFYTLRNQQDETEVIESLKELLDRGLDLVGIQSEWDHPLLLSCIEKAVEAFGVVGAMVDDTQNKAADDAIGFAKRIERLIYLEIAYLLGGRNTNCNHVRVFSESLSRLLKDA